MAKEFFMNGEVYVRNGADTYRSRKALQEVERIILKLEKEQEQDEYNELVDLELEEYIMIRDRLKEQGMILDSRYIDEFYVLKTNGVNFELESSTNHLKEADYRTYNSKKMLDNEFTSLIDFLNKATFVGRKFRRLKPIEVEGIKDYSYTDIQLKLDGEVIVLFAMQDLFLVKDMSYIFKEKYELISSKYLLDCNYEFYGNKYIEYNNKALIYKEVVKQLKKEKVKKRIKN